MGDLKVSERAEEESGFTVSRSNLCRTEEGDKIPGRTEETGTHWQSQAPGGGVFNTSKNQLHPEFWINHTFSDFKQYIYVCDLNISH